MLHYILFYFLFIILVVGVLGINLLIAFLIRLFLISIGIVHEIKVLLFEALRRAVVWFHDGDLSDWLINIVINDFDLGKLIILVV